MQVGQVLHRISTNVRFLTGSLLLPEYAAALAERLFLTPPRSRLPQSSFFDFLDAHSSYLEHRGRTLAVWRWGPVDAPAVLLVHGWGGYAAQMRGFVPPLLAAGYKVIAYDQPAHGLSEGRLTGLPDFARALDAVVAAQGKVGGRVQHVIAHSLGGVGAALAIAQAQSRRSHGLQLKSAVLISPPSDMVGFSRRFARWYWMAERLRRSMQAAIEERFGVRWSELEMSRLAPRLRTPALVIHDRHDAIVPWTQGAALARAWPGARLLTTQGLGHGRILESEQALTAAVNFISGRSGVAPLAAPETPYPAPLY